MTPTIEVVLHLKVKQIQKLFEELQKLNPNTEKHPELYSLMMSLIFLTSKPNTPK